MLKVTADRHTFEIQTGKEGLQVNGQPFEWDLLPLSPHTFHIIHRNQSYNVEVLKADYEQKTFTIRVNNQVYQLRGQNQLDLLLEQMGMGAASSTRLNHLKAPMPGLILDIKVSEGETVKKGDPIMILEAMKMENIIKSPGEGTIKTIKVRKGENVEKNQVLIEFGG